MKHKITIITTCCLFLIFVFSFEPRGAKPGKAPALVEAMIFDCPTDEGTELKPERASAPDSITTNLDEGIDVMQVMLEMNGDDQPQPSSDFREGHVSDTDIKDYLTKTRNGFIIKLPGTTNVPTATVYDGKIFVSGGFGSKQYYAFQSTTGEKVWAVDLDDDGPSSGVIDNDIIVFNTESCTIFACERSTGKSLWSHWLGDPLMCMPAIANDIVFTSYPSNLNYEFSRTVKDSTFTHTFVATHVLAAFDLKTGKTLWQKWIDGDVMSAPVAKGNELFITTFPGTVCKFNQKKGEIISAKYMRATSAPVIQDDDIIVSRRTNNDTSEYFESIAHLDVKSAGVTKQYMKKKAAYLDKDVQEKSALKSESMDMDAGNGFSGGAPASSGAYFAAENIGQSNVSSLQSFQGSRAVIYNGMNYNTMGDEIICTNPVNGSVVWKSKLDGDLVDAGGFLGTPPLSVGGYIIIATFTGEVKVLNAETGDEVEKYETGKNIRYQPVVDNGWIYVTTTNGMLVAINTENPKLTGWPMWGADAAHTNVVQ